jgi:hypothetical protein
MQYGGGGGTCATLVSEKQLGSYTGCLEKGNPILPRLVSGRTNVIFNSVVIKIRVSAIE